MKSSPYDNYWIVLDTDYDNFLIKYTCLSHEDQVNSKGQTKEDVE